ncbi:MAG TPA: hypothetical protein VNT30_24535 [Stellaceae bacterium]|nr:hypothetical protein [Stellaceae bacterium]
MQGSVVAFVGENANGILEWWTSKILERIEIAGIETHLIDLLKPNWNEHLTAALNGRHTLFAFSFQGMGNGIAVDGQNVWDKIGIPFFTYMGDNPYHNPKNHWIKSRRSYLLYSCKDFYDTYTNYMKGPNIALLHPQGFPENPHANEKRWSDREIDLVYVKTGIDPKQFLERWDTYPKILRSIARDAAECALTGSDETIADICAARFAAESVNYGERSEIFFGIASQVDHYVRAHRAAKLAQLLIKLPVRIYGNWDFLDQSGSLATFHGSIPAADLPSLYANSRIVANIAPSVRYGVHERITAGFMAKCVVLSDVTPIGRTKLAEYPGFLGFDVDSQDFVEQVMAQLNLPSDIEDRVEASYQKAIVDFSLDRFLEPLFDMRRLDAFTVDHAGFSIG